MVVELLEGEALMAVYGAYEPDVFFEEGGGFHGGFFFFLDILDNLDALDFLDILGILGGESFELFAEVGVFAAEGGYLGL